MNKPKKLLALLLAASLACSMTACGGTSAETAVSASAGASAASAGTSAASGDASGKVYHVGIIQLLEHQALDAATKGFETALTDKLGDSVEFDYQNAQGEEVNCSTISAKFVSDGCDLIMANATTALQAASAATGEIPIVGTSITDYVAAGVVNSNDAPGGNVTGVSDLAPIDQQIALLQELVPSAKKVGILYCSAEANSIYQAQQAEAALDAAGIEWAEYTAADSNDLSSVVTKAVSEVDTIYIPTDNTIANNMEIVKNLTVDKKIPVICGEENMTKSGGLATLSISYYDLGYQAGEMAYEILVNGKNPGEMPIEYVTNVTKEYNPDIASALGITVPDDLTAIDMSES